MPSPWQFGGAGVAVAVIATSVVLWIDVVRAVVCGLFVLGAAWRALILIAARPLPPAEALADEALPRYTVIVPLHDEAAMAGQIVSAIDALDYPRRLKQVLIALETDDGSTRAAFAAMTLPDGFAVVVAPKALPQTKPRACNVALAAATGALITIYDAEDRPEAGQLREAAARFAAGPARLGCLQAPLRIPTPRRMLPRQFGLEYALQFEVLLPAMARLGLPFPLGGTSNHLRREALQAVGGWDPFNVTEDADLGFRLARAGWTTGVLSTPTRESAPDSFRAWLPQRTRWFKGYLQTVLVQAREGWPGGRTGVAIGATLGLSLVSAALHLPTAAWLASYSILGMAGGPAPSMLPAEALALAGGWCATALAMIAGARRAAFRWHVGDVLFAPFYWPLLSLALWQALFRLVLEPHHWDKTAHRPWPLPAS